MASTSGESTTLLPLRLIDVGATLEPVNEGRILLCKSDDWNFHIISHTWSQSIRDLSRAVEIGTSYSAAEGEKDEYRAAFEARDWIREGKVDEKLCIAYHSVKDFLEILQSQGVKKVWLDAICINQKSKKEKEREISRMKDFYSQSLACYVPVNGFADENTRKVCKGACGSHHHLAARSVLRHLVHKDGKIWNIPFPVSNSDADGSKSCPKRVHKDELYLYNLYQLQKWRQAGTSSASIKGCDGCGGVNDYRLFADKGLMDMRWMNRVWTLQELLLPKDNIYFIVQLETWMEEWLAMAIETNIPLSLFDVVSDNGLQSYVLPHSPGGVVDEKHGKNNLEVLRLHTQKNTFAGHENRTRVEAILGSDYMLPMKIKVNPRRTPMEWHLGGNILETSAGSFTFDTRKIFTPDTDLVGSQLLKKLFHHSQPRLYIINAFMLLYLGKLHYTLHDSTHNSYVEPGVVVWSDRITKVKRRFWDLCGLLVNDNERLRLIRKLASKRQQIYIGVIAAISCNIFRFNHFIMDEICKRGCSKDHEEDRVLGMLGLVNISMGTLGSDWIKNSPEEQIVELANRRVLQENFLLELCIRDYGSGRNKAGMSWIPDLTEDAMHKHRPLNDNTFLVAYDLGYLKVACYKKVLCDGPITLTVPVVINGFITRLSTYNDITLAFMLPNHAQVVTIGPFIRTDLKTHLYECPTDAYGNLREGGIYLPLKNANNFLPFRCYIFPLFMVPYYTHRVCSPHFCALVCIRSPSKPDMFHKIGVIVSRKLMLGSDMATAAINFEDFTTKLEQWIGLEEDVTIGGLGIPYLDDHLDFVPSSSDGSSTSIKVIAKRRCKHLHWDEPMSK